MFPKLCGIEVLAELGLDAKVVAGLRAFYQHMWRRVRLGNALGPDMEATSSLVQGDPFAGLIVNGLSTLVFDEIEEATAPAEQGVGPLVASEGDQAIEGRADPEGGAAIAEERADQPPSKHLCRGPACGLEAPLLGPQHG